MNRFTNAKKEAENKSNFFLILIQRYAYSVGAPSSGAGI
jgi:hypothetical protein